MFDPHFGRRWASLKFVFACSLDSLSWSGPQLSHVLRPGKTKLQMEGSCRKWKNGRDGGAMPGKVPQDPMAHGALLLHL